MTREEFDLFLWDVYGVEVGEFDEDLDKLFVYACSRFKNLPPHVQKKYDEFKKEYALHCYRIKDDPRHREYRDFSEVWKELKNWVTGKMPSKRQAGVWLGETFQKSRSGGVTKYLI